MNRTGKLVAIKRGIYLKQDVKSRKAEQVVKVNDSNGDRLSNTFIQR